MSTNASGSSRQTRAHSERQLATRQSTPGAGQIQPSCPTWCRTHERADVGHRDEALIHYSRRRKVGGHEVRLHRWDQLDSARPGEVLIVLDDEFLTARQARARSQAYTRLAALLVEAADGEL